MKIFFLLTLLTLLCLASYGQEKENNSKTTNEASVENKGKVATKAKRKKVVIPDSTRPNYLNIQRGLTFGLHQTNGEEVALTYERKIDNIPIAWSISYTFGNLSNYNSDFGITGRNRSEPPFDDLELTYHHLSGSVHQYLFGYDRREKLYIGLGGFVGLLDYHKVISDEETDDDNIFDIGGFAVFGFRWSRGSFKGGLEYRISYLRSNLFEDDKYFVLHEIGVSIGVQF